jgi:hypothetical protein
LIVGAVADPAVRFGDRFGRASHIRLAIGRASRAMELIQGFRQEADWPEIAIGALQLVLAVLLFVFRSPRRSWSCRRASDDHDRRARCCQRDRRSPKRLAAC